MQSYIILFCTTTLLLLAPGTTLAAQQWVRVLDQNGSPVEDAIVSFKTNAKQTVDVNPRLMGQKNIQFSPKVLIVPMGQHVLFPNTDSTRHHVYSFSKPKPFEIKLYKGIPNEPIVFDIPGLVVLGCNIHDAMTGFIYVTDQEVARLTDSKGMSQFDDNLPRKVSVWHANHTGGHRGKVDVTLKKDNTDNNWLAVIDILTPKPKRTNTFKSRFGK